MAGAGELLFRAVAEAEPGAKWQRRLPAPLA